jgi:hypothetical protein
MMASGEKRSESRPASGEASIVPRPKNVTASPAFSGEKPRSRVAYRTRNGRIIDPARLTRSAPERTHTAFGSPRRLFQRFIGVRNYRLDL